MNLRHLQIDIKHALQRAFRGYDDTIKEGYGLEYTFEVLLSEVKKFCEYEMTDEVKNFCEYEMTDKGILELSPKRKRVFTKTIKLINEWEEFDELASIENILKKIELLIKASVYITKNMSIYWD